MQNLSLFLFAAAEAHVQIALSIFVVHLQQSHSLTQLLAEIPRLNAHAALLLQSSLQKAAEADAGNLQRILEGQEQTGLRTLVHRQLRDILAGKLNAAVGNSIFRITHERIAQGRFAGAVRSHQDMRFTGLNIKIQLMQNLFVLYINSEISHL